MIRKSLCRPFTLFAGFTSITLASSHAEVINQIANSTAALWNEASNWTGGAVASNTNSYVTTSGLVAPVDNGLNVMISARLRENATTFAGSSLTVGLGTEVLLKNGNNTTSTANLILNGGVIRYGPNGTNPAFTTTLAGTLNVMADSVVGLGGNNTVLVSSSLAGSSALSIRGASGATTSTLSFSGDLSGFHGTFDIGGGSGPVTLDFNQDYNLQASLVMGTHASVDILKLDQAITVSSFQFGAAAPLLPNTYTVAELNGRFGNGSQFIGTGTLTVAGSSANAYADWATNFGLTVANNGKDLDPDNDGQTNFHEFAFGGDPRSNQSFSESVSRIATVDNQSVVTLTVPIRIGASFAAPNLTAKVDGITYDIQGSTDLVHWDLTVAEVPLVDQGPLAAAATTPPAGYTNRFFYIPGSDPRLNARFFMRALVTDAP